MLYVGDGCLVIAATIGVALGWAIRRSSSARSTVRWRRSVVSLAAIWPQDESHGGPNRVRNTS